MTEVTELTVEQVRPLRRTVLRAGMATEDVSWPEDDTPGAFHLGIVADGDVIAVSTWVPRPLDGEPAFQVRGMATAAGRRGQGLGAMLVQAGCSRVAASGIGLVWANARDTALPFYERHGFAAIGDGFVDATTQLPHHRVVRRLR